MEYEGRSGPSHGKGKGDRKVRVEGVIFDKIRKSSSTYVRPIDGNTLDITDPISVELVSRRGTNTY